MTSSKKLPLWSPDNQGSLQNSPHHPRCCMCPEVASRYPIPGNGPRPSKLLFIGEAPSYREDRQGVPFAGPTGVEFTYQYLPLTGYMRSEVRVTNAVRCSDTKYRNPKPLLAQCCSDRWLEYELRQCQPTVIIAMGSIACSIWPSLSLSRDHGYAIPLSYKSWSGYVFPIYHPAMGLHSGPSMRLIQSGFYRLGQFLRALESGDQDRLSPWVLDKTQPYPSRHTDNAHLDYRFLSTRRELYQYLRDYQDAYYPFGSHLAIDSEFIPRQDANTTEDLPYSLSLSIFPTTAAIFRVDGPRRSSPLIDELRDYLIHQRTQTHHQLICHYSTADLPILDQLSLPWSTSHLLDTATTPYHLSQPQSLKILSHRLLRVRQQTFDELTEPLYHSLCYPLAERLSRHKFPHPKGDRSWAPHRYPSSWLSKSLSRYGPPANPHPLDLDTNPDTDPNPEKIPSELDKRIESEDEEGSWSWDRAWRKLQEDHPAKAAALEAYLGHSWPRRTIALAPDEDLRWYAGADADLTLRIAWVTEAMRGETRARELCGIAGLAWESIPGRQEWEVPLVMD